MCGTSSILSIRAEQQNSLFLLLLLINQDETEDADTSLFLTLMDLTDNTKDTEKQNEHKNLTSATAFGSRWLKLDVMAVKSRCQDTVF